MEGQIGLQPCYKTKCYILASKLNFPWTLGMQCMQDILQFAYSYLPTVQEAFRVKAVCVHYCQRSPSQKTRHTKTWSKYNVCILYDDTSFFTHGIVLVHMTVNCLENYLLRFASGKFKPPKQKTLKNYKLQKNILVV